MTSFRTARLWLHRLRRFDNICLGLSLAMCAAMVGINVSIWSAS